MWHIIHRVLNTCAMPFNANPDDLNVFFSSTAERTFGKKARNSDLFDLINAFDSSPGTCTFQFRDVTQAEVLREIKALRADFSTRPDQIPVKFIKPVAEFLAGPLAYIINSCIRKSYFPEAWKIARVSPIPKVNKPKTEQDDHPISILLALFKVFERLEAHQVNTYIIWPVSHSETVSNVIFSTFPDYRLKRLQRVQNMCAGYVMSRYATVVNLKQLGWLPIRQRLEYNSVK